MKLTIMTWNILAPMWVHSNHFPGVDTSIFDPNSRREAIFRILKNNKADIICLQEVQKSELEIGFIELMEQEFHIGQLSSNEPTCWANWLIDQPMQDNGTIVLLRKETFSDINIHRILLSDDGNAATLVICQYNNQSLVIVNNHLDTDSPLRRQSQIEYVETLFKQISQGLFPLKGNTIQSTTNHTNNYINNSNTNTTTHHSNTINNTTTTTTTTNTNTTTTNTNTNTTNTNTNTTNTNTNTTNTNTNTTNTNTTNTNTNTTNNNYTNNSNYHTNNTNNHTNNTNNHTNNTNNHTNYPDNNHLNGNQPTFLWVGDFNIERSNKLLEGVFFRGWRDLLKEKGDIYPTSCSSRFIPRGIDFVLSMGSHLVLDVDVPKIEPKCSPAEYCVWSVKNFGSDHLPATVTIQI